MNILHVLPQILKYILFFSIQHSSRIDKLHVKILTNSPSFKTITSLVDFSIQNEKKKLTEDEI